MLAGRLDTRNLLNRQHPLARGLVSWWLTVPHLYGGRQWYDLCGFNHGVLTNMTSTGGWRGTTRPGGWGHLAFDGVDDYLSIADADTLDIAGPVTLSVWLKGSNTANKALCEKGTDAALVLQPNGANQWFYFNSLNPCNTAGIASAILNGAWRHVLITFDGTSKFLYLDGIQQHTAAMSTPSANSSPLVFGSRSGAFPWTGSADALMIHSRALAAAEARALYDETRLGCPGLLRRWRGALAGAAATSAGSLFRSRVLQSRIIQAHLR